MADRAREWAETIKQADELAALMRPVYLKTGNLPWPVRLPVQAVLRWCIRVGDLARRWAREDMGRD